MKHDEVTGACPLRTDKPAASMSRLHLFEINDLPYISELWRNAMTDCLAFLQRLTQPYSNAIEILDTVLRRSGTTSIIDFGSGSAGPLLGLYAKLHKEHPGLNLILTDKFPHLGRAEEINRGAAADSLALQYRTDSISMENPPAELIGLRTMFTSFHHLKPEQAEAVLQSAATAKQPIAIFETTGRTFWHFLMIFLIPFLILLLTPFLTPRSWPRFLITYLVPLVPLGCLFDGIVSNLRTYSPEDLLNVIKRFDHPEYLFEVGYFKAIGPMRGTYLIGYPVGSA